MAINDFKRATNKFVANTNEKKTNVRICFDGKFGRLKGIKYQPIFIKGGYDFMAIHFNI